MTRRGSAHGYKGKTLSWKRPKAKLSKRRNKLKARRRREQRRAAAAR